MSIFIQTQQQAAEQFFRSHISGLFNATRMNH